jgi:hypothetical protein
MSYENPDPNDDRQKLRDNQLFAESDMNPQPSFR